VLWHQKTEQEKNMNTDYTFRRLSSDEVLDIYENSCPLHFPAPEIKPVFMIQCMVERGGYIGIGVYDGDRLAGYALCVQAPEKNTILLDYLAVFEEYRNKGVGALMLQEMQRIYTDMHGIIIETERPDKAADEEDRAMRIRRNGFYKRSGCRQTELLTQVAGVDFGIFYLATGRQMPDEEVAADLQNIYDFMLGEKYGRMFAFT